MIFSVAEWFICHVMWVMCVSSIYSVFLPYTAPPETRQLEQYLHLYGPS